MTVPELIASIPAPPGNSVTVGPLTFRYYGLMIAFGVLAAVEMARRRWAARGHDPDDIIEIAKWAVPAGLIGTRIYHVVTDWRTYFTDEGSLDPIDALLIWKGGLGIPGGLALGIFVGVVVARRRGMDVASAADAIIPGIPVAQAIGRLGNWFNQEIFGKPSDLPWALEVDERFRPAEFADSSTFHPTFLYEGVWNLALAWALIQIDKRKVLRPGQILPLYIVGYGIGRFIVESMRTDSASLIWGIRVNHWVSGLAVLGGLLWFGWMDRRPLPDLDEDPDLTDPDTEAADSGDPVSAAVSATGAEAGVTKITEDDGAEPQERLFGNAKSAELVDVESEEIPGAGGDGAQ